MSRLPSPDIEAGEGGTLRSRSFGDIYYSPEDGLAESRYVFVGGNDLPRRFERPAEAGRPFVIGELGFGTGLNLIAAWAEHDRHLGGPLSFWSCEGYPLPRGLFRETLNSIAARWPDYAAYAERLARAYPDPVPGTVQLRLDEEAVLTLAFGEALPALREAEFKAEAWFLDGFAPSRNEAMWSAEVFEEVARLSRPGATAATFTVASSVRANLEAAGFAWEKATGFGRKKHMLRACLPAPREKTSKTPWFASPEPSPSGAVAIIGGGIAGACLARALRGDAQREVELFDPAPGGGASGNPAGLIMPRIDADDTPAARFYRDAFLYAVNFYTALGEVFSPCGGAMPIEERKAALLGEIGLWPEGSLDVFGEQVSVPGAGVLRPGQTVEALLSKAPGGAVPINRRTIETLAEEAGGWRLRSTEGETFGPFAAVVLASGAAQDLWPGSPVRASLGQIDVFGGAPPSKVLTDGSYVGPLGDMLVAGATYAPHEEGPTSATPANTDANRRAAEALLARDPGPHLMARAALRATTPDRHPIAGQLYDEAGAIEAYRGLEKGLKADYPPAPYAHGLYALTGLGSRGLVTAPILAAHLAAEIGGGVSPLTRPLREMVHPGRFLIRAIRRGKFNP